MPQTLFIADLHLSDDTPALNRLFLQFLRAQQGRADALYILGDLFEVWLGDDMPDTAAVQTAAALKAFSQSAPVYFIGGNRDFLLGRDYAQRAGITLLPDICEIELYGTHYLISHGDEMCTGDLSYQRFRRIIRQPWLQTLLRALPQGLRRRVAAAARAASKRKKQAVGQTPVSDVTGQGVQTALSNHPQTQALIHGHTHRPAVHQHGFNGRTVQRYVLPDWHGGSGGYLKVSPAGVETVALTTEAV
ncbi:MULTISPECIES: UDP-2,3-diacylglucosamine diphosphatase [unclassified Neisseria]|uniref:UDP-2,3-diacylglucosamine diphosphatase n=1 Tax=unclassified Neisseria TaxID=2623750 RepID=UPI001072A2B8|nr:MULTISPECIES: UDP-2,3-diacylglucosamine diphosphatase [unclassified Neisseria]MBF0804675.1 UDP-2,3-diacylglucosamine diphosphatase [Neisseria sp. 19428wB4_WF04]TFU40311.1 UDP-2,3-diacylglucosamine diphosphatase [Neisseria sp. WF04]